MDELRVNLIEKLDSNPDFRTVYFDGRTQPLKLPGNAVKNTRYNLITLIPLVLYNQFKYFFNFFYLMITLSQLYPPLQVGFLVSYVAPLSFVLAITIFKEGYDDFLRWRRDKEVNGQIFTSITSSGRINIPASEIKVGQIIEIKAGERIPADMALLSTSEESGAVFIRTDQLDGETDWKLRKAISCTQAIYMKSNSLAENIAECEAMILAEEPQKNIYSFIGTFEMIHNREVVSESLGLENTLWSSTVLTKGIAIGLVLYTGKQTRSSMNSNSATAKFGITDDELNYLSKFLFGLMVLLALSMVIFTGINSTSYILFFRHLLLLSSIIPISLRVNLDMAKIWYCYLIERDKKIPNTIARNSSIPEELGRIEFLLTDKTGTLTLNEMTLKKLNLVSDNVTSEDAPIKLSFIKNLESLEIPIEKQKEENLKNLVKALAICHNVTPVKTENEITFQASSPDEVAFVKYAGMYGIMLTHRSENSMWLELEKNIVEQYAILENFPFSSSTKRMGIIVQHLVTGNLTFYLKGAEDVMKDKILGTSKFKALEDCETLGRDGLRTLIISKKKISLAEYKIWKKEYELASISIEDREKKVREVIDKLEVNMEILGVTGVEDKLQKDVGKTIEDLRNAGIVVWILTGDKVETAQCIAISTRLKRKNQEWFELVNLSADEVKQKLKEFGTSATNSKKVIVIDGGTLNYALKDFPKLFIDIAIQVPAVVCCRVAPTQKSQIVELLKKYTKKRLCSIGDGGNDVGMILAAHMGIGVEGKEGKQASLAADFSIAEFSALRSLILWHGRQSYKRTSKLSNFVFHRGLIISFIQILFNCMFYFNAIPIYNGILMMGYATIYTNMPVFSIVLDQDADFNTLMDFPLLYFSMQQRKSLGFSSFCICVLKSCYQGAAIIILALVLFPENNFINIVSITFTALIFTELLNVMTEIDKFHWAMGVSTVVTGMIYLTSMFTLKSYFDLNYLFSSGFLFRTIIITITSWAPVHFLKKLIAYLNPADYEKLKNKIS
jgi:phospholipid-translocating ATPase